MHVQVEHMKLYGIIYQVLQPLKSADSMFSATVHDLHRNLRLAEDTSLAKLHHLGSSLLVVARVRARELQVQSLLHHFQ